MAGKETKKEEQTQRGIDPSGGLTMNKLNRVKVWDLAVRVFHWGLVVAFALAYFTGRRG
jgi:hypothetical protein